MRSCGRGRGVELCYVQEARRRFTSLHLARGLIYENGYVYGWGDDGDLDDMTVRYEGTGLFSLAFVYTMHHKLRLILA